MAGKTKTERTKRSKNNRRIGRGRQTGSWVQGYYTPINPEKYVGDVKRITYMSSWECQLMRFFDTNENILRWASEEIAIPYIHPGDGLIHKYFPDFWIEKRNPDGTITQEMIEVKPQNQVIQPSMKNRKMYETWLINRSKWQSAEEFCRQRNIKFRIITEKDLFGKSFTWKGKKK
jgi:hypothetical protein